MMKFTDTRLIPTPGHVGFRHFQIEGFDWNGLSCTMKYVPNIAKPHKREEFRFWVETIDEFIRLIHFARENKIPFMSHGVLIGSPFKDLQDASNKLDEFHRGIKYTRDTSHNIRYIKRVVKQWEEDLEPAFMACKMSKQDNEKFVDCMIICGNLKSQLTEQGLNA